MNLTATAITCIFAVLVVALAGYYLGRMACKARISHLLATLGVRERRISHLLAQRHEILAEWEGGQDFDRVMAHVIESEEPESEPLREIAVAHTRKRQRAQQSAARQRAGLPKRFL